MEVSVRAVVVMPGNEGSAQLTEMPDPQPRDGECLVRVLEVGVDGTDREIDGGEYGEAPEGEQGLIIGHESLGRVERVPDGVESPREGDLVVATVRRGCPQRCPNCAAAEYDFCSTGDFLERGIKGAHGFMAELYAERPEHLIVVPPELRGAAVLLEPFAILERAFRLIFEIQRRLEWRPARALITGAGNMGIIAAFHARLRDLDTVIYSRHEQDNAAGRIMRRIGVDYVNSEEHSIDEVVEEFGAPDIAIEGTGFSPLAWETAGAVGLNGIACLLSVTNGDETAEIPSDELNRRLVLGNRVVFGSVNAHRADYDRSITTMLEVADRWPDVLDEFITHRRPLAEARQALDEDDPAELKSIIEVTDG